MRTSTSRAVARYRSQPRRTASMTKRALRILEYPEAPYLVLLLGFTGIGLLLRLDRLGLQSLWFDEADMVMLAQARLSSLLANFVTAGQNGPLYTLFLHLWISLVGSSEVAVRLPSALAGTLTIPLLYATGRALHGPKLGLYAAGIFTIAPYQQWYAREAKMYAIVVLLTLASTLFFIRALRDDRRANWAAYAVCTTLALYVHVTAALVMAAQILYFLVSRRRERAVSRRAWIALLAVTVPYLPLAVWESRFVLGNTVTWHPTIGLLDFLRVTLTKFAVNRADLTTERVARWAFGTLALLGAAPLTWRHDPWARPPWSPWRRSFFLAVSFLVPLALFYAVTLAKPLFSDRYLIIATPPFVLLVAGGILGLERYARPLAPLALALVVALSWVPLRDVNLAGGSEKEDWRTVYRTVGTHAHPRDLLIIEPGYLTTTFDYYRQQPMTGRLRDVKAITVPTTLTAGAGDQRGLDLYLQRETSGYERVWLVISPDRSATLDPKGQVREWFTYNASLIDTRTLNGVWYGLYAYNRPFAAAYYPQPPVRDDLTFGDQATLIGHGYDYFPDESQVRPGTSIPLLLRWSVPPDSSAALGISWRLLDPQGLYVAGAVEPLFGNTTPPNVDRPGELWDYHDLPVPADLPAGRYRVEMTVVALTAPETPLTPRRIGVTLDTPVIQLGWVTVGP